MASTELRIEDVRWDLSDCAADADDARARLHTLAGRATAFAERYRGSIGSLDAPGLRAMLDEADELEQELSRLGQYSRLRLALDAVDAEANDLATVARDRLAEIDNELVFLPLEWIAIDDDVAERLLAAEELAPYAHKLRVAREEKPYVLTEAEEQALNVRRPLASAWAALHDRQAATLEIPFDAGEGSQPHTLSTLLAYLYRPDRELRLRALAAVLEGLVPIPDV
jgi:oligoendopeptidase F